MNQILKFGKHWNISEWIVGIVVIESKKILNECLNLWQSITKI